MLSGMLRHLLGQYSTQPRPRDHRLGRGGRNYDDVAGGRNTGFCRILRAIRPETSATVDRRRSATFVDLRRIHQDSQPPVGTSRSALTTINERVATALISLAGGS